MKRSDTERILELLTQLTEAVSGPATARPPNGSKLSLSDRVDKLDTRVSEVQLGLATLAADTKAQFTRIDERFNGMDAQFEKTDAQFKKVDTQFEKVDAQFKKVDRRFDKVDRSIEASRVQVVDLVTRVHDELTGRIIDLEVPKPGGSGSGGRGTGGSGVPLAS
jgi:septal ring factor EnvC (AmiA/AmiB activator)